MTLTVLVNLGLFFLRECKFNETTYPPSRVLEESGEVEHGRNEACLFSAKDYYQLILFDHEHIDFMAGHAIQTSFPILRSLAAM